MFSNGVGSLVPAGGQCPRFDDDSCAEGLLCNGTTCETPATLAVPSTTAFTVPFDFADSSSGSITIN